MLRGLDSFGEAFDVMNSMRCTLLWLAASCAAIPASAVPASADTFVLNNGGSVEGELLNANEAPRVSYVVRTSLGRITLPERQVRLVRGASEEQKWYQATLTKMPATLEGNWKMAEMCLERGLTDERRIHMENVLTFDTNHEAARRGLGYTRLDKTWIRTELWMMKQGLVRRNGEWRSSQEHFILEATRRREATTKEWYRTVKRWHSWLRKKRHADAVVNFRELKDPLAAEALVNLLEDEKSKEVKLLLIETLSRLKSGAGVGAFLKMAMSERDADVADACVDSLVQFGGFQASAFLMGKGGLQSVDNPVVNRAATVLARLKDAEAVPALIDALITEHKFILQPGGGAPGSINPVFGGGGGGGLNMGGKPKIIRRKLQNPKVHAALMSLVGGVDFKYDKAAWKRWLAYEQTPRDVNLRRRF
jgi:hypothetical protein